MSKVAGKDLMFPIGAGVRVGSPDPIRYGTQPSDILQVSGRVDGTDFSYIVPVSWFRAVADHFDA